MELLKNAEAAAAAATAALDEERFATEKLGDESMNEALLDEDAEDDEDEVVVAL